MTKKQPTVTERYRAVIISREDSAQEFDEISAALDWGWAQLRQQVTWANRASLLVLMRQDDGHYDLITQIIASERVGMFDRASEQYTLPRGRS